MTDYDKMMAIIGEHATYNKRNTYIMVYGEGDINSVTFTFDIDGKLEKVI